MNEKQKNEIKPHYGVMIVNKRGIYTDLTADRDMFQINRVGQTHFFRLYEQSCGTISLHPTVHVHIMKYV